MKSHDRRRSSVGEPAAASSMTSRPSRHCCSQVLTHLWSPLSSRRDTANPLKQNGSPDLITSPCFCLWLVIRRTRVRQVRLVPVISAYLCTRFMPKRLHFCSCFYVHCPLSNLYSRLESYLCVQNLNSVSIVGALGSALCLDHRSLLK